MLNSKRHRTTTLLCLLVLPVLHGCLFSRVMQTRAQLCDAQPSTVIVQREPGRAFRVVFEAPTLTDRDIIWIVGLQPSAITGTGAVRELLYEALPLGRPRDRETALVMRLSFVQLRGDYRLSEVELPERFTSILPPQLVETAMRVVCRSQVDIFSRSVKFDLADVDTAALPRRDDLAQLLGPPTAAVARANEISYHYCLAPCSSESKLVATLLFSFKSDGNCSAPRHGTSDTPLQSISIQLSQRERFTCTEGGGRAHGVRRVSSHFLAASLRGSQHFRFDNPASDEGCSRRAQVARSPE